MIWDEAKELIFNVKRNNNEFSKEKRYRGCYRKEAFGNCRGSGGSPSVV